MTKGTNAPAVAVKAGARVLPLGARRRAWVDQVTSVLLEAGDCPAYGVSAEPCGGMVWPRASAETSFPNGCSERSGLVPSTSRAAFAGGVWSGWLVVVGAIFIVDLLLQCQQFSKHCASKIINDFRTNPRSSEPGQQVSPTIAGIFCPAGPSRSDVWKAALEASICSEAMSLHMRARQLQAFVMAVSL